MKSSITLLVALVLMVGSAFANTGEKGKAINNGKVTVVKWNAQIHRLFYEGTDEKIKVRVLDEKGAEIWKGSINNPKKGFALPLNFKRQDAGSYHIEVKDSKVTYLHEIQVTKD